MSLRFHRAVEPRSWRSEAVEPEFRIDHTQIAGSKAHEVTIVLDFRDADSLARQGLSDEDVFAAPADAALVGDPAYLVVGVVPGILDSQRQGAE